MQWTEPSAFKHKKWEALNIVGNRRKGVRECVQGQVPQSPHRSACMLNKASLGAPQVQEIAEWQSQGPRDRARKPGAPQADGEGEGRR